LRAATATSPWLPMASGATSCTLRMAA
jgi:hypothetical protein